MKKILIINASPRNERSHSRKLTRLFMENWLRNYVGDEFMYREVGLSNIPHVTEKWIAAAFNPINRTQEEENVLELSNLLVSELKAADIYVLGVPMYNWSIPSGLKAYIDQIMRINETWKFRSGKPDGQYVGLLRHKKMFILSSRGDSKYEIGEENESMNFQTTYLQLIFNIMGVTDIEIISLNNEEFGGERFESSQREIYTRISKIR